MSMAAKTITFTPQYLTDKIQKNIKIANEGLSKLQSFVAEHGETWADVLTYSAKGADHKKQARLAEIRAWMDKNKTPSYIRPTMEREAVADLGAANLEYWGAVAPMLRVKIDNYTGAPALNLAEDVDASGDVWRVAQSWIDRQEAEAVVTMPEFMVNDLEQFKAIAQSVADLAAKGYAADDITKYLLSLASTDNLTSDINPEVWFDTYRVATDNRVDKSKIE